MLRRSPSRNNRSKGIKVKHVLQIILLLGVCFWLIYQVKHSHDKKKEFDEDNGRVSVGTQTEDQIPKLGRKDLRPVKDEVNQKEKHEEDIEDENIEEEDENKHELNDQEEVVEGNEHETEGKEEDGENGVRGGGEEQEEDENKREEIEDEGVRDDVIDGNDQDRSDVDTDRDELVDEEKEREESDENDDENTEGEEKEGSVENQHTHEAREKHYKGDDASSAVTHDTHTTSTESETVSLENSDDNSGMGTMKSEDKPNFTEESSRARNQTSSTTKITGAELVTTTGGTTNATSGIETGNKSLSNPVDSSHLNSTATTHSDTHSEASSNLKIENPGASNNMTQTGADTSHEQNKIGIFSDSYHAQNDMMNTTVIVDVKNVRTEELQQGDNSVSEEHPDSNTTATVNTENGNAAAGQSANLEGGGTGDASQTQNNPFMKENTDANGNEKLKGGVQTGETGESSESLTGNGTVNSIDHSASDSHILKDVTESHTDPVMLTDIRNTDDSGKTATE